MNHSLLMKLDAATLGTIPVRRVMATQDVVDALLSINSKNRSVSNRHVDVLSQAMANNEFVSENGQMIVINHSGTWLMDGQHRLLAMRKENYPSLVLDVYTIPDQIAERVFKTIDTAERTRTTAFVLASLEENAEAMSFVKKATQVLNFLYGVFRRSTTPTANMIARDIDRNRDALEKVITKNFNSKGIGAACFLAGAFTAMKRNPYREDAIMSAFIDVATHSINGKEFPALARLHDLLTDAKYLKSNRTGLFVKTIKALESPTARQLQIDKEKPVMAYAVDF